MEASISITRSREELKEILTSTEPPASLIPELAEAAQNPDLVRDRPGLSVFKSAAEPYLADIENIPRLTYTRFRDVQRYTNRYIYRVPQMEKRAKMAAAAVQVMLGDEDYVNTLYDYMWSTCEETKWILPQREDLEIDLRVCGTGFTMAELIVGLAHKLEARIVRRVREEIDRRVFTRYLDRKEGWWKGHNNWNGVCNGGIGAMFLLLEDDVDRLAHGLHDVLEGLEVFMNTAFEADGGSGEGVGYWHYGLTNFSFFAELLRRRTNGEIDLLGTDRMRTIATYPPSVMLSPGKYFSYSDSDEETSFHPGLVQRIAERTGVEDLYAVLAEPGELRAGFPYFHRVWRALLWWDGTRPERVTLKDAYLPDSRIVRLVGETPSQKPVVLATKAMHNAVPHNQNDVGVIVLHADGETFICDPERGVYDQYKIHGRYNVPFAGSYGHSVPRIGGIEQSAGPAFEGEILEVDVDGEAKHVEMRIERAYDVPELAVAHRALTVTPEGEIEVEDTFTFSGDPKPVEEAFVTWLDTTVDGARAVMQGEKNRLELTIEAPENAAFDLEVLEEASEANNKEVPLKRLTFMIDPSDEEMTARVRARVLPTS
jgi:hypothetical protein